MNARYAVAEELGLVVRAGTDLPDCGAAQVGRHTLQSGAHFFESLEPGVARNAPRLASGLARTHVFAAEDRPAEVLLHSRWINFIGAALTPELLAAANSGCPVCVFEPSRERLAEVVGQLPLPVLMKKNCLFFCGDAYRFAEPLRDILPASLTAFGPPAVYERGDCPESYAEEVRNTILCAYYHEQLYPFEYSEHVDDLRPVAGGYNFTHLRNLIGNLGLMPHAGTVADLRGLCQGKPMLLVAAGPDLTAQMPLVERLRPHCVIISASKACRALLQHGIVPDMIVLQDTTLASARELADLDVSGSVLVSYMLASSVHANSERRFFYGSELEDFGLATSVIPHYGSVLNYMIHLAATLGCGPVYLAGVSLASREQHGSGYAQGLAPSRLPTRTWPYAVTPPGHTAPLYTTLNFFDTAHWLRGFIRKLGLTVINLTRDSILYGPGIVHDPDPAPPAAELIRPLPFPSPGMPAEVLAKAQKLFTIYHDTWTFVAHECARLLALQSKQAEFVEAFAAMLRVFDAKGITTAVRGFWPYIQESRLFPAQFFQGDPAVRAAAAQTYLTHLSAAAALLLTAVADARQGIRRLPA